MSSVSSVSNFNVDVNILVNSFASSIINYKTEILTDFPFHLVLSGNCNQFDTLLEQLMAVTKPNDVNILFMKFDSKGKYVAVQCGATWITDNFMYYSSSKHGDWLLVEFDDFFKYNAALFQTYSGTPTDTTSIIALIDTTSINTSNSQITIK